MCVILCMIITFDSNHFFDVGDAPAGDDGDEDVRIVGETLQDFLGLLWDHCQIRMTRDRSQRSIVVQQEAQNCYKR